MVHELLCGPTRAAASSGTHTRGSGACRDHPHLQLYSRSCAARRGVALHQECAGRWSDGPAISGLDPLATSVNARGSRQRSKKYGSAARTQRCPRTVYSTQLSSPSPCSPRIAILMAHAARRSACAIAVATTPQQCSRSARRRSSRSANRRATPIFAFWGGAA